MGSLIVFAAGMLIGWNIPQPEFVRTAQATVIAWVKTKIAS